MDQNIYFTFFEHLDELRKRLIISLVALAIGTLVSFCYVDKILVILSSPISSQIGSAYFFSPAEAFVIKIKVALLSGLVGASPVLLGQLWLFISPALYGHEKRAVFPLILITSSLFVTGALFSFFKVLPMTLQFLMSQQTAFMKPMVSMNEYISFASGMILAFGVAFNLPVVIVALVSSGFVSLKTLWTYHRHVIVVIFIVAAVLTPGPDIASQLMLAIPLTALFEMSFLAAFLVEVSKKKNRLKKFTHDPGSSFTKEKEAAE